MSHPLIMSILESENDDDAAAAAAEICQYHKGVKFLYDTGISKLPTKYILPMEINTDEKLHLKLPVIDFSMLQEPPDVPKSFIPSQMLVKHLIVNHGIPPDVMNNMRKVGSRFFDLPYEERSKFMASNVHSPVRYGTSFNQSLDTVFYWRDFLKLMCHPMSDVLPLWPSSPADFRIMTLAFSEEVKSLFLMLMEAVLESLGMASLFKEEGEEEDRIMMKNLKGGSQMMVINCYPPCPEPDLTLGLPPHSDFGLLTLLLQDDEVEGLQIKHGEDWITVQPIRDSFVVNVGDHLEILSNGKYRSVLQ